MRRIASALLCAGLITASPLMAQDDSGVLAMSNNRFAFSLYGALKSEEGNLFFSPASISAALGMAYAGAKGETAMEMKTVLQSTLSDDDFEAAMGTQLQQLNRQGAQHGYHLHIANALWGQQGYDFKQSYLDIVQNSYGAKVDWLDFENKTEASRKAINDWVEGQTEHKITDLVPEGAVTASTRLVLTNAVYFKRWWETQFDKNATQTEAFHLSSGATVQARLMHRTGDFNYLEQTNVQLLELPYRGGDLSMVIILPRKGKSLSEVEASLTSEHYEQWLSLMHSQTEVAVTLPVFKATREVGLKDTLDILGMHSAFTLGVADFSGMTGNRELFLSDVIHKGYIEVGEEGTEAAAATAAIGPTGAPPEPIEFKADHPFLFLIRDLHSGGILFMGRLENAEALTE